MGSIAKRFATHTVSLLVILMLVATTPATASDTYKKDDFQVRDGVLYKGLTNDKNFTLKAIQVPDAGERGAGLDVMVSAMAHIAEVGGNTLCFDLPGFSTDAKSLDPSAMSTIAAYTKRAKDQRMAVMVRVLGNMTNPKMRKQAIKTASKRLRDQQAIYLIDGPDAASLARLFKRSAPTLIVASPANGDITIASSAPSENPKVAMLVNGKIPDLELSNVHFLLNGDESDYAALDEFLARPEEKETWNLDPSIVSEAERAEGFVPLFDGKTLDGWWMKDDNKEAFHASEDGFIEWRAHGGGALMTAKRYGNFICRMQYKIMPGGNSGVWFRAPRGARQSKIGFEVQMRGDNDFDELDKGCTGAIYDVIPPAARPARKEGLWNDIEVICDGPNVKITLNGTIVQDVSFDDTEELKYRLRSGFICLTDHSDYTAFRNIRIKEL